MVWESGAGRGGGRAGGCLETRIIPGWGRGVEEVAYGDIMSGKGIGGRTRIKAGWGIRGQAGVGGRGGEAGGGVCSGLGWVNVPPSSGFQWIVLLGERYRPGIADSSD